MYLCQWWVKYILNSIYWYSSLCVDSCADFYKFLRMQCEISHIPYPNWANQWIDVKTVFSKLYSCRRGRKFLAMIIFSKNLTWVFNKGIADMLNSFGLQLYGHLHSGLDDAINIGRIIIELIKVIKLFIDSSMKYFF